ncbi:MAG: glucose-1-phosphate thymidylyltransferase [Planctomycetaceae bacterium]|nr:glucose-1-phosphate thymidylyltransferase [Planctomycetaceae bacterium]MDG1809155.1 putative sugar nucleotidyl transferase [Pirellulaceae bacterium]MDG2103365.1 putative sugar nucleotidyl transferase [Pirellulaceae bacterium]
MNILIVEDPTVALLSPVTTGRAMPLVTCAGWRLYELAKEISPKITFLVRDYLAPTVAADFPDVSVNQWDDGTYLLLNARLAPTASNLATLQSWLRDASQKTQPSMLVASGRVMAAISTKQALQTSGLLNCELTPFRDAGYQPCERSLDVIESLHDLVRINEKSLTENLNYRLQRRSYFEIADGVYSADERPLPDHIVTETQEGPIVLETGWSIGPFTLLRGPIFMDANSRINEHASIKESVSIGPTCKVGGEIEATVIEGFSNKQHHGFLGHSYLGSWINLGAGTCNSDLKNTYGLVNMQHRGEKINTGMQFVGCFMGDYAKTAINTSIFTGKTIGVCSMVYGVASKNVAAFTNDAQLWNRVTEVSLQVMIETQKRMFTRRGRIQRDCDQDLLKSMFELSRQERNGLACEPLVF